MTHIPFKVSLLRLVFLLLARDGRGTGSQTF